MSAMDILVDWIEILTAGDDRTKSPSPTFIANLIIRDIRNKGGGVDLSSDDIGQAHIANLEAQVSRLILINETMKVEAALKRRGMRLHPRVQAIKDQRAICTKDGLPETIWAEPHGDEIVIHNNAENLDDLISTGYLRKYTRDDIYESHVKELEDNINLKADWIEATMNDMVATHDAAGVISNNYICKKQDWDHDVIDVFLVTDGVEYQLKGFDDVDWEEADAFVEQIAKNLNIDNMGDMTDT
jgi:hypothetical protein